MFSKPGPALRLQVGMSDRCAPVVDDATMNDAVETVCKRHQPPDRREFVLFTIFNTIQ